MAMDCSPEAWESARQAAYDLIAPSPVPLQFMEISCNSPHAATSPVFSLFWMAVLTAASVVLLYLTRDMPLDDEDDEEENWQLRQW